MKCPFKGLGRRIRSIDLKRSLGLPKGALTSGKSVDEILAVSSQEGEIRGNKEMTSHQYFRQINGSGT